MATLLATAVRASAPSIPGSEREMSRFVVMVAKATMPAAAAARQAQVNREVIRWSRIGRGGFGPVQPKAGFRRRLAARKALVRKMRG